MKKPQSILVCVDFSHWSAAALAEAAHLAAWGGASLHIAHVVLPLVVLDMADALSMAATDLEAELIQQAKDDLKQFAATHARDLSPTLHVVTGDPFTEIERLSREVHADLLVMGLLGAGERGTGAGTVATKCVHSLPVPPHAVLLTTRHAGAGFKRVLAAVDFSQASAAALEAASLFVERDRGELHALHVYTAPWHRLHYKSDSAASQPAFREQFVQRLQSHLEQFIRCAAGRLPAERSHAQLVDSGSIGFGIIDFARQHHVDLITLGARGHSKLTRLLLGSTADRLLREAPCSLLIVKL